MNGRTKTIILIVVLAVVVFAIRIGLYLFLNHEPEPKDKTFTKENFSITLTDEFVEMDNINYTAWYTSPEINAIVIKEPFSDFANTLFVDMTAEEYAELLIESNVWKATVGNTNSMVSTIYSSDDYKYKFMTFFFKGTNAYYALQFQSALADFDDLDDFFIKSAETFKYE